MPAPVISYALTMQTRQQIQQLLASAGLSPNKRRGQHFLIDLNLMRLLIDSADIRSSDVVLEVGCGTGSLTEELVRHAGAVVTVEVETTLVEITKRQLAKSGNVKFFNVDVLESKNTIDGNVVEALISAQTLQPGRLLLVSNLPYSIASSVMANLVTGPVKADAMYVTVQKEIADRMMAGPGSKDYGTLSIVLTVTGDVKMIRTLKPSVFWPQPQVDSAMISFVRDVKKARRIHNMEIFSELVNLFMQHRRKMLRACAKLATGKLAGVKSWPQVFQQCMIDPQNRPEQISPENYISIANLCMTRI